MVLFVKYLLKWLEQILIPEMTLEPEPSNIEERKPEPEDNLYALIRCDCYKSTCCYHTCGKWKAKILRSLTYMQEEVVEDGDGYGYVCCF